VEGENVNDATYILVQAELADMVLKLRGLQVSEFLVRADMAEAIAPLVDPSLYQRGGDNLAKVIVVARAAQAFLAATQDVPDELLATLSSAGKL
jgi:hypothetical protein